jgi:hypothetical protein
LGKATPHGENASDEPGTLEIRKYQNRRYYESTRSRHLSLQQIHKLIIERYNIRVLDAFLPPAPGPASESNEDPGSAGLQNEIAALRKEVSKLKAQFKLRSSAPRKKQTT